MPFRCAVFCRWIFLPLLRWWWWYTRCSCWSSEYAVKEPPDGGWLVGVCVCVRLRVPRNHPIPKSLSLFMFNVCFILLWQWVAHLIYATDGMWLSGGCLAFNAKIYYIGPWDSRSSCIHMKISSNINLFLSGTACLINMHRNIWSRCKQNTLIMIPLVTKSSINIKLN